MNPHHDLHELALSLNAMHCAAPKPLQAKRAHVCTRCFICHSGTRAVHPHARRGMLQLRASAAAQLHRWASVHRSKFITARRCPSSPNAHPESQGARSGYAALRLSDSILLGDAAPCLFSETEPKCLMAGCLPTPTRPSTWPNALMLASGTPVDSCLSWYQPAWSTSYPMLPWNSLLSCFPPHSP